MEPNAKENEKPVAPEAGKYHMISFKTCLDAFLVKRRLLGTRKHAHAADTGKKPLRSRGGDSGSQKTLVFGVSNVLFNVTLHTGKRNVSSKHCAVYYLLCAAPASPLKIRYPVHMESQMVQFLLCGFP